MAKKKSLLLTTLLAVLSLAFACVMLTACGGEQKENRAITWTFKTEEVTVTADGYDTLPEVLQEGTELTFSVTPKTGYQVGTVTGAKKDGNNYKLTVGGKDVTVKVNASKILNDIEVKGPTDLVFFEDNTVDKSVIEVTAKYALGDEKVTDYTVEYQNGSAFAVGDTAFTVSFGGKSKTIELATAVKATQTFDSVELTLENDVPVLVVKGYYNAEGDAEAAKTTVEGFFNNVMERGTWATKNFIADATVAADKSFTLKLTIEGTTAGHQYFFHIKGGSDGQDFTCPLIINESAAIGGTNDAPTAEVTGSPVVATDGTQYYIGYIASWGSNAIMIHVVNENAPQFTDVSLEVKNNKPYAVFNGTATVTTTEEDLQTSLLKIINHLDLEDISNGNAKLADYINENAIVADEEGNTKAFFEFDTTAKTFKLYVLLEGDAVQDGANFFAHLGTLGSAGYYPNVSLPGNTEANSITCNGFVFSFTDAATIFGNTVQDWQSGLLYINVKTAA